MASKQRRDGSKTKGMDAISLLMEDHKYVQKLFKEFEKIKEDEDVDEKQKLVRVICTELSVHAQIEEEIFYPAARNAIDEQDLLDEAEVEHASAKELITQLESMQPDEELYDAKVCVLGEYVNHHVKEEQDELFPKVKKADLDLQALGQELLERKQELIEDLGLPDDDEAEGTPAAVRQRASTRSKSHGHRHA